MTGWVSQASYLARFALGLASGRPLPAIAGLSITDQCNLDCRHCWRKNTGAGHAPFERIAAHLRRVHAMGARYLYLQGGEAFTWREGELTLADVVAAARETGFFHVAVCTNGTFPLDSGPDSYSVSLEGAPESHDAIRCGTFQAVLANIRRSAHPNIFVNATLNRRNAEDLEYLAKLTAGEKNLRGLLVNFHIPYPGVEGLALDPARRRDLAQLAMRLKRQGFPILNTLDGLAALRDNDWPRPLPISVVSDCRELYRCCRARGNDAVCRACGYGLWAEAAQVLAFRPAAIWAGLRRLHGR